MMGAIAGDVIGSTREFDGLKDKQWPLFERVSCFTDDSLLTVEVARWLMDGGDLVDLFHECVRANPDGGWGGMFEAWATARRREPYNSFGNGSAMRVSPVGWVFDSEQDVLEHAERSAAVTHNHPEGIKGAQAVALAVYMARTGAAKDDIRRAMSARFRYAVHLALSEVRRTHSFDETCQGSVPEALIAFLESEDWEDAVRNAISLGGDADTQACIAGAIAEAFYGGVPDAIREQTTARLTPSMLGVVDRFETSYIRRKSAQPR